MMEVILVGDPHRSLLVGKKIFVFVRMQVDLNMCFPSLQLLRFYKEISLPHFANGNEITQSSLREERHRIASTTEIPFD